MSSDGSDSVTANVSNVYIGGVSDFLPTFCGKPSSLFAENNHPTLTASVTWYQIIAGATTQSLVRPTNMASMLSTVRSLPHTTASERTTTSSSSGQPCHSCVAPLAARSLFRRRAQANRRQPVITARAGSLPQEPTNVSCRTCFSHPLRTIPGDEVSIEGYKAATVLEPIRGFYTRATAYLDLESLYPNIIRAQNLSHETSIVNVAPPTGSHRVHTLTTVPM